MNLMNWTAKSPGTEQWAATLGAPAIHGRPPGSMAPGPFQLSSGSVATATLAVAGSALADFTLAARVDSAQWRQLSTADQPNLILRANALKIEVYLTGGAGITGTEMADLSRNINLRHQRGTTVQFWPIGNALGTVQHEGGGATAVATKYHRAARWVQNPYTQWEVSLRDDQFTLYNERAVTVSVAAFFNVYLQGVLGYLNLFEGISADDCADVADLAVIDDFRNIILPHKVRQLNAGNA